MSRALPLVALVVALVALTVAVLPGDPPPPPAPAAVPEVVNADVDVLRQRIELLEGEQRRLWDRLAALERGSPSTPSDGGAPPAQDLARLREEVRDAVLGDVLASDAGRGAVKELLREADRERERDRAQKFLQLYAERSAARRDQWKHFVSSARLSYQQEQTLSRRLDEEDTRRKQLFEALSQGTASLREVMRGDRQTRRETDELMATLLSPEQHAKYEALRQEEAGALRRRDPRTKGAEPER